ncbi:MULTISPECIES: exodeoxyribonuclease VII large subunit [unclassified Pseudoalteromonas]|uniref:exodeoxyribonuclease VII large subunit n=1 Tax=unclassified Pseudoalteromonas TaxID=194690 RepID=UPI0020983A54|nr:exodeoxyribonuclease VII large subunit [Pseudoalteromonas sp. XMcav2-N]MCO7188860.1 exodeoxyribonuclease VII large subunit [Pseudoalteromonas sp. XMcav2-N]
MSLPQQEKVYSVSRLNREIRSLLEQGFASLQLTGEISNFVAPASGHWYFSLKDDKAQVKAAMWRGNNRYCRYRPQNGEQVLVQARVSVYEPRGDYQLIVEQMAPAGEGLLKQQFDALKLRLAGEGLFSSQHKQPLPARINRVGVVTSPTGAAVRDILSVLKRRAPQLEVVIYPTQVQGQEAHHQIAAQIELANIRSEVDVLIVGRGGGSLEDLWCFNEETVARAIFASQLPVISAVGHEIDTTISDYVADLRAPTPSAAAELVSPDGAEIQAQLGQQKQRLSSAMQRYLTHHAQQLQNSHQRLLLQHPQAQLMQQAQKVDELSSRLLRAMNHQQHSAQSRVTLAQHRLAQFHPEQKLRYAHQHLDSLKEKLTRTIQASQQQHTQQLALLAARLDSVSPLAVLSRGYSITKSGGKVVKSTRDVTAGDILTTELHDGRLQTQVIDVTPAEPNREND